MKDFRELLFAFLIYFVQAIREFFLCFFVITVTHHYEDKVFHFRGLGTGGGSFGNNCFGNLRQQSPGFRRLQEYNFWARELVHPSRAANVEAESAVPMRDSNIPDSISSVHDSKLI